MFYEPLKPNMGPLILRWGLAVILLVHGGFKLFYGGAVWNANLPAAVQLAVAVAEVVCGVLLVIGFLTRFAGLVVAAIQLGAIFLVTGTRNFIDINTLLPGEHGDTLPFRVGYEYNVALIVIAVSLFFLGSGALSVDDYLWRHRKKPASASPSLTPAGGAANPV